MPTAFSTARRRTKRAWVARALSMACVMCYLDFALAAPAHRNSHEMYIENLGDNYEVVTPTNIVRGGDERHPKSLRFRIDALDGSFHFTLERHDALFEATYQIVTRLNGDENADDAIETHHPGKDHCHYRGSVRDGAGRVSSVSASICGGIIAQVRSKDHGVVSIEPASAYFPDAGNNAEGDVLTSSGAGVVDPVAREVIVYRYSDIKNPPPGSLDHAQDHQADVSNVDSELTLPHSGKHGRRGGWRKLLSGGRKLLQGLGYPPIDEPCGGSYIDRAYFKGTADLSVFIVNDATRRTLFNSDAEMHDNSILQVNLVQSAFDTVSEKIKLRLTVAGQYDFNPDPYEIPTVDNFQGVEGAAWEAGFKSWWLANYKSLPTHTHTAFFSSKYPGGGLAPLYGICMPANTWNDTIQSYMHGASYSLNSVPGNGWQVTNTIGALVFAHELGHNLAMHHDGYSDIEGVTEGCPDGPYIMGTPSCLTRPGVEGYWPGDDVCGFSECSKHVYECNVRGVSPYERETGGLYHCLNVKIETDGLTVFYTVLVVVAFVAIVGFLLWFWWRRRKQSKVSPTSAGTTKGICRGGKVLPTSPRAKKGGNVSPTSPRAKK